MKRVLLGMLTPSSNTSLEPLVSAMAAELPGVSAHFGRFRVTEISLRDTALGQFDERPIMGAAKLLADAKVNVICWKEPPRAGSALTRTRRCAGALPPRPEFRRALRCSR